MVVNGNVTFSGDLAGDSVTLNGTVNLGAARGPSPSTSPLGHGHHRLGQLTSGSGSGLIKNGPGILLLNNTSTVTPNNYTGATTLNGGIIKSGAINSLPTSTAFTIAQGAAFDMASFNQTVASLSGDTPTTGGMITNSSTTVGATFTVSGTSTTTFAVLIASRRDHRPSTSRDADPRWKPAA